MELYRHRIALPVRPDTVAFCSQPGTLCCGPRCGCCLLGQGQTYLMLFCLTRTAAVQFGALTLLSHCILCLPINRRAHSNQQTILFIATDTKHCRPRSKVVLEKLLVALLLKKSLALYGTHSYTCVHPAYHFNMILPSVCLPLRFP